MAAGPLLVFREQSLVRFASVFERIDTERSRRLWATMDSEKEYTEVLKGLVPDQLDLCYPFASDGLYTIFNNGWRRRTLDITDPRIESGMQVLKTALVKMRDLALDAGVQLFVLVIPTKEHTYWPRVRATGVNNPVSEQQLRFIGINEPKLEKEIMQFMSAAGITASSMVLPLRQSRLQSFFGSRDAHINEQGHRIVAAELFKVFANTPETR